MSDRIHVLRICSVGFFPHGATAPCGPGLPASPGFTITLRHTTYCMTTLDDRSARRTNLYLTKQHSEETGVHAPSEIRTRYPSKRAASDPCRRPRGHWDRLLVDLYS
jgi:hypothetical protein